jgi:xylose isomerase
MNRISAVTAYLGANRSRYIDYQPERTLADKLAVASQAGLDGLEICYPADFGDVSALKKLLSDSGLGISGINFRSRRNGRWWRGSFTSESAVERAEVVDDLKKVMDYAATLGCDRITTCPLNDGHDYPFEMNYLSAYRYAEQAFAHICVHNPAIRICIEYKRSDPRARCLLGTAGEALAFCQSVGAPNLGVTMDVGHSRYAGERPAQAACLLAYARRLFYVHLNDNDGIWDWDMIPGAYSLWEFVELFYYLQQIGYDNDWYACDVAAKEINTVATFQTVVATIRKLEAVTGRLEFSVIEALLEKRDPSQVMRYLYSII